MSEQPTTDAGRAMLQAWARRSWSREALRQAILAIEVETCQKRSGNATEMAEAAARRDPEPVASADAAYIGFWMPDGEVSPVVVDYTRPLLREATKHGRDSMTISGIVWTFTAIEAAIRGTEAGLDVAARLVADVAVGVCNDWMGDPDHGFVLDPLALPVDAYILARLASADSEPS